MQTLKKAAVAALVAIAVLLLTVCTAIISTPRAAHALDRIISGNLYQLVVVADPVSGGPLVNEVLTDRSGTVTLGGTAQTLMAANANRRGFLVQNNSAGPLWINELGGAAVQAQPSVQIPTGQTYVSQPNASTATAVSIVGATTAQAFTAREW